MLTTNWLHSVLWHCWLGHLVYRGVLSHEQQQRWRLDHVTHTRHPLHGNVTDQGVIERYSGLWVQHIVVSPSVSRGLTSHSTLYRSLQARWPNQQRQSTKESQLTTEDDIVVMLYVYIYFLLYLYYHLWWIKLCVIGFNPTRIAVRHVTVNKTQGNCI